MKNLIFEMVNTLSSKFIGPTLRNVGRSIYEKGVALEPQIGTQDRVVPSLRRLAYGDSLPDLNGASFVAPNATILGDVKVGERSSIWYGVTIVGAQTIVIGNDSVIQDRVHISQKARIGNEVFVGPNSTLQGSTLKDRSFVAMGATVRQATVESGGLVAAGAVIPAGATIREGEIWIGNPGRFLRQITPEEREILLEHLDQMQDLAAMHAQETEKTPQEVMEDDTGFIARPIDAKSFVEEALEGSIGRTSLDEEFIETRIFMTDQYDPLTSETDYEPYSFNTDTFGDKFKIGIHEEQLKKVATRIKAKEKFQTDSDPWKNPF